MNCRRSPFANEMRRRGYDVEATKSDISTGQHGSGLRKAANTNTSILEYGENKVSIPSSKTPTRSAAPKALLSELRKQPNGSRGEVGIEWKMGGGHSIAYEIVNYKPVIFDTQRQTKIKTATDFTKAYDFDVKDIYFTRLDTRPLNTDWLERWVKDND